MWTGQFFLPRPNMLAGIRFTRASRCTGGETELTHTHIVLNQEEQARFAAIVLIVGLCVELLSNADVFVIVQRTCYLEPASAISAPVIPAVYNRDSCPICLGEHTLAVESNCGHLFCGQCLQQYYRVRQIEMISCPLCRATVTVLFVCFSDAEIENQQLASNRERIYNFVNEYNQCCSRFRLSFRQILTDWPTTMRHLFRELTSINGLMRLTRARISLCLTAAVLYLLSPLDIIPETLFGLLGFLDDVLIIILLGLYVSVMYRRLIIVHGAAGNSV